MEFVAVDVETANRDYSTIRQIGLARYKKGSLSEKWKTLNQGQAIQIEKDFKELVRLSE
jgi:hypothetical protein